MNLAEVHFFGECSYPSLVEIEMWTGNDRHGTILLGQDPVFEKSTLNRWHFVSLLMVLLSIHFGERKASGNFH